MLTAYLVIAALVLGLMALFALFISGHRTPIQLTPEEVAAILERFVQGTGPAREWDDFISFQVADPELEAIAARCRQLPEEFPPEDLRHYTNTKGLAVLNQFIEQLRAQAQSKTGAELLKARS
jgi:hypothetical protein